MNSDNMSTEKCVECKTRESAVSAKSNGTLGGTNRYCHFCYLSKILKLLSREECLQIWSELIKILRPAAIKTLLKAIEADLVLIGPTYTPFYGEYEGRLALSEVLLGKSITGENRPLSEEAVNWEQSTQQQVELLDSMLRMTDPTWLRGKVTAPSKVPSNLLADLF